jgi:integrase
LYGRSKGEAQEKLRRLQNEGVAADPGRLTLREFAERWLENTVKPTVQPGTYDRYEVAMRLQVLPHPGGVQVAKLKTFHAEQMYASLDREGVSDRNRQMAGVVLGTALRHAVRVNLTVSNPVTSIPKPKVTKKEMRVWTADEAGRFLEAAKTDRLNALFILAIATGMRAGELLGLKWMDIDFGAGSVQVQRSLEEVRGSIRLKETKSAKGRRRIDLPRFTVDALHEHRKRMTAEGHGHCMVFCDTEGGFLRKSNLRRRCFLPPVARAGVPVIRFHDLRHTAATLLLLQGENPKIVAERLGHASIELTLDTYSHVLPTMQRGAAEKLDRLFG